MPGTYKSVALADASTSGSTVITATNDTVIVGFRIANKSTVAELQCDARINLSGGGSVEIIGINTVIPIGSSLEATGTARIFLNSGDSITVTPDTASVCDVHITYIEFTDLT